MFHLFLPSEPSSVPTRSASIQINMTRITELEAAVQEHRSEVNDYLIYIVKSIAKSIRKNRSYDTITKKLLALDSALTGRDQHFNGVYWVQQSQTPGGQSSKSDYILRESGIGFLVTGGGNKSDVFIDRTFYWRLPERTVQLAVGMVIGVIEKSSNSEGHVRHTMPHGLYCVTKLNTTLPDAASGNRFAEMKQLYYDGRFHPENLK